MTDDFEEELQDYKVIVGFDKQTKALTSERWLNEAGVRHHPLGQPAARTWDPDTGELTSEMYYQFGDLHREEDMPAEVYYDPTQGENQPVQQTWHLNGVQTRLNGLPSRIKTHPETQVVVLEEYTDADGNLHRAGGLPAVIQRHPISGKQISASFYEFGILIDPSSSPAHDLY